MHTDIFSYRRTFWYIYGMSGIDTHRHKDVGHHHRVNDVGEGLALFFGHVGPGHLDDAPPRLVQAVEPRQVKLPFKLAPLHRFQPLQAGGDDGRISVYPKAQPPLQLAALALR